LRAKFHFYISGRLPQLVKVLGSTASAQRMSSIAPWFSTRIRPVYVTKWCVVVEINYDAPHVVSQWVKLPKNSLNECAFVNSALKIQGHIVRNTLLQTAFSAHWDRRFVP